MKEMDNLETSVKIEKTDLYMPSSSGADELHIAMWKPEGDIRGILQISHGMIEYIDRYDRFAKDMAEIGFLVIGNDHLGHGETAAGKNYGYFAPKNGSYYVVRDLHRVTKYIRKQYPDVPLFLLGHSMGSFMARRYAMTYGKELDGVILMGTGGKPEWLLKAGQSLIRVLIAIKGERAHSKIVEKLCFAFYNRRFKPVRTPSDWLTRDKEQVDAYRNHKYCQFTFTLNGYRTLFEVISFIQQRENILRLPRELPMYFLSGYNDPVGNYGKSVKKIARTCRWLAAPDSTFKLYPGARHELLNETNYEQVQEDIVTWLEEHMK